MATRILRLPNVIHQTGLARSTIYKMMKNGDFPKSIPLTETAVGWTEDSIDKFVEQRINQSHETTNDK